MRPLDVPGAAYGERSVERLGFARPAENILTVLLINPDRQKAEGSLVRWSVALNAASFNGGLEILSRDCSMS